MATQRIEYRWQCRTCGFLAKTANGTLKHESQADHPIIWKYVPQIAKQPEGKEELARPRGRLPWKSIKRRSAVLGLKGKEAPQPTREQEVLEAERQSLFDNGSEFQVTARPEIVGIDNVLNEIEKVIHWLKNSEGYTKHKSRLEPGIIFEGDPGTGKTLVSRYIASASDALFVNVRDFPHQGNLYSDSDIRKLFQLARETYAKDKRPVVLFWDEFENVACERSEATPEQVAVVSQLTAELDGVHGKNAGILLVGCTNYIHGVDKALRRSGRMGLQFEFHAPDRQGKQKILAHYLATMKCEGKIDTETLSHFFDKRATAADIEEACVEAWRNAVGRSLKHNESNVTHLSPSLQQEDLVEVFIKRLVGPPTTFTVPEEERKRIAIHEIGHAVVAMAYGVPLRLITVQPGKKSLGRTMVDDVQEYIGTIEEAVDWLRVGAGGLAGERAAGVPNMIGATGDISQMNQEASRLVDRLQYDSDVGLFNIGSYGDTRKIGYTPANPLISEEAITRSDRAVKKLLDRMEREADHVMVGVGKDALWGLAEVLNSKVTMTGAEFETLFRKRVGDPAELKAIEGWALNGSLVQ